MSVLCILLLCPSLAETQHHERGGARSLAGSRKIHSFIKTCLIKTPNTLPNAGQNSKEKKITEGVAALQERKTEGARDMTRDMKVPASMAK